MVWTKPQLCSPTSVGYITFTRETVVEECHFHREIPIQYDTGDLLVEKNSPNRKLEFASVKRLLLHPTATPGTGSARGATTLRENSAEGEETRAAFYNTSCEHELQSNGPLEELLPRLQPAVINGHKSPIGKTAKSGKGFIFVPRRME